LDEVILWNRGGVPSLVQSAGDAKPTIYASGAKTLSRLKKLNDSLVVEDSRRHEYVQAHASLGHCLG
jgi:hypothetical protein